MNLARRKNLKIKPIKRSLTSQESVYIRAKISPKLKWMYPFLVKAKNKMPSLLLPRQIRPFKPNRKKIMRVFGNVYFDKRLVVVSTHTQVTCLNKKGKLRVKRIVRLPKARMLDTLAHELAHLLYTDHGYEHEEYTKAIFKTFDLKEKCPHCKGTGKIELESKP